MRELSRINSPKLLLVKDITFDVPAMLRILWPDGTLTFSMFNNDETYFMNDTGEMEYSFLSGSNIKETIKKMNLSDKKSNYQITKIISL